MSWLDTEPRPATQQVRTLKAHLLDSTQTLWRGYRKKLRRCQEQFSDTSVHELRVQTRRLLALVSLIRAMIVHESLAKTERQLKKRLDTFAELRDTQVQLRLVERVLQESPRLQPFQEWLQQREQRLIKRLARRIDQFKTGKLSGLMAAVRKQLKERFAGPLEHLDQLPPLLNAVDRAYAQVVRLRLQIDPADTATIHRVRLAFKRFRYMIESLQPMLPEVRPRHVKSMHDYQTMMGDIQDVEVLMARVEKLAAKKKAPDAALQSFREELMRRRGFLIRTYLDAADQLFCFWSPRR